jgi:methionyl-tRNA synthetase
MNGTRGFLLHEALQHAFSAVAQGNEFVQSSQPWVLAKQADKRDQLHAVLAAVIRLLARQAVYLFPFMPGKAQELWAQLGGPGDVASQRFADLETLDVADWRVSKGAPLFPKPVTASAVA